LSPFIPYKVATMIHLRKVYDFINRISLYGAYLAAVMGGLLILVVLAEIVRRTVFGSSFLWTFEISSWLLVGFAFMGMGYTLQSGGHVRVTLLTNRLSEMSRTRLDMALALVGAGMFGYLSVFFFGCLAISRSSFSKTWFPIMKWMPGDSAYSSPRSSSSGLPVSRVW